MSSETSAIFTKENLDIYLKELAKEFRKLNGKSMPAEIILIGGAAILANYGFRNNTNDIDAVIKAASSMKSAINHVGDKFKLSSGWLNDDFVHTNSYSVKLSEVSVYYKTFSNILEIRTISAEYLIAMKLRSGRKYKNDLSDVVGILAEQENRNLPLSFDKIDSAVQTLYGSWDGISADSQQFIKDILRNGNYTEAYNSIIKEEQQAGSLLFQFCQDYPNKAAETDINNILASLKVKQQKEPDIE